MSRISTIQSKSRRQREKQARIDLIRSAATRVFAKHGFAAATMEQVAAAAELGKATLYYYFPNKQELFADIARQASSELARLFDERLRPEADPIEQAAALYHVAVAYFRDHPDLAVLLLPLMAAGPKRTREMLGDATANEVMKAHQPFFAALEPLAKDLAHGKALTSLLGTVLIGLSTKLGRGGAPLLQEEIALFFDLLTQASARRRKA